MRKLIIAIVVLAVAYLGTLFFVKSQSTDAFERQLAELDKLPQFNTEIVEKNEGLFSATAVANVFMHGAPDVVFSIKQTQSYGPILLTEEGLKFGFYFMNTDLIPGDKIKQELPAEIDVNDLFDIHFFSGFGGNVEGDVYFKGLDFADEQGQFSISPAEMHVDTDMTFEKMVGNGSWPGMTITHGDNGEGMSISGVKLDFNQNLVMGNWLDGSAIYEGEGTYIIDEVVFNGVGQFFKMENLSVKGVADVENETSINMAIEMSNATLSVAGEKYTDNRLNMYFNGLDMKLLQQIGEISQKMQAAAIEGQDVNAYNMQLMNAMLQLVQKGPSVQIKDTQIGTEDGLITADLNVNIDKEKMDPNNPMAMMLALNAVFDAEAPEAYFAKKGMQGMIDQWAQMNFLVKDNGKLKVNATMQNGMTLVNGQPMQGMPGMQ